MLFCTSSPRGVRAQHPAVKFGVPGGSALFGEGPLLCGFSAPPNRAAYCSRSSPSRSRSPQHQVVLRVADALPLGRSSVPAAKASTAPGPAGQKLRTLVQAAVGRRAQAQVVPAVPVQQVVPPPVLLARQSC